MPAIAIAMSVCRGRSDADQSPEGKPPDEKVKGLLVATDFPESDRPKPVLAGPLDGVG
jgi:hypothetical protein